MIVERLQPDKAANVFNIEDRGQPRIAVPFKVTKRGRDNYIFRIEMGVYYLDYKNDGNYAPVQLPLYPVHDFDCIDYVRNGATTKEFIHIDSENRLVISATLKEYFEGHVPLDYDEEKDNYTICLLNSTINDKVFSRFTQVWVNQLIPYGLVFALETAKGDIVIVIITEKQTYVLPFRRGDTKCHHTTSVHFAGGIMYTLTGSKTYMFTWAHYVSNPEKYADGPELSPAGFNYGESFWKHHRVNLDLKHHTKYSYFQPLDINMKQSLVYVSFEELPEVEPFGDTEVYNIKE